MLKIYFSLTDIDLDSNDSVKPTYVKILVENINLIFFSRPGIGTCSYFENKILYSNDLPPKDYVRLHVKSIIGRNGLHMLKLGINKNQFIYEKESNSSICNVFEKKELTIKVKFP